MKCFQCGAEVPPATPFCGHCGTRISDPHESTLVVPAEAPDALLQRLRMVLAGEYDVEHEIGRGGMAVVFKATEVGLGRAVALKVLPPDLGLTVRAIERFKREARMVAELDHPNIIPVYRVGQFGGVLHIAMKFIEGRSLDAMVESQGPLPIPVVLYVLRGTTRALAYAHDRGIVHRDVKGANILIDRDGRLLVSDFGVALRAADVTLTVDGTVIGTPPFMSPEQCSGQRAGPQSDQYSVGIVAFQMLTGRVPFQADTLAGIMQHHFFTPVPDVRTVRDDVPSGLVDVLHVALAKEPAARFPSTRDMLAAIDAVPFSEADRRESERILRLLATGGTIARLETRALPALPDSPTVAMRPAAGLPPRRPRARARLLAGVAAAIALIGGAAWWASRAGGTPSPATGRDSVVAVAPTPASPGPRQGQHQPAGRGEGLLRLLTSPTDAEIFIDGRKVGQGALFDDTVAAGPRRLRVSAKGYETFDTTIIIPRGETVRLDRIVLRGREGGA
jgi:predicted Ser/Thr protein kinase